MHVCVYYELVQTHVATAPGEGGGRPLTADFSGTERAPASTSPRPLLPERPSKGRIL